MNENTLVVEVRDLTVYFLKNVTKSESSSKPSKRAHDYLTVRPRLAFQN